MRTILYTLAECAFSVAGIVLASNYWLATGLGCVAAANILSYYEGRHDRI